MKYPFLNTQQGAGYSEQPPEQPAHKSRLSLVGKMDVKIFLMFKHWKCKYLETECDVKNPN